MNNKLHTSHLTEIPYIALIVSLAAILTIPLLGALIGTSPHGWFLGSGWKTAWLYGLLAVYTVNLWWSLKR